MQNKNKGKNTSPLNEQGQENKRKLLNEDEYFSKVNEINEGINIFQKIIIFLSSFKNLTYIYLTVAYGIPFLILFLSLFIEGSGSAIIEYLNSTGMFNSLITIDKLYNYVVSSLGLYLTYVDFGWLINLITFNSFGIQEQFHYFREMLLNQEMTIQQATFFSLLIITFVTFIFNIMFWIILGYIFIPKSLWKGKGDNIEYNTQKFQKYLNQSSTLIDGKMKKKAMEKTKKYKKYILNELKKAEDKNGVINDFTKILQVLPAYKIAFNNRESIFINQISMAANKKWANHVKKQTTIENFDELKTFLLKSLFSETQQDIVLNLNWIYPPEDIFPNNTEDYISLKEKIKKDKKTKQKYKIAMMQYLMIIKFFKNYPIYAAIRFLETQGLTFDKVQSLILTNSRKIIINQLNEPKKILDLSLELTLPNIKNQEKKKKLIRDYSDFINNNNKQIALLENEAETEVLWEPDTRFKIMFQEYKHNYMKILENFIKIIFENYNMKHSENFENNIQESFNDFFDIAETDAALVQISNFKVIKMEDFYNMLDMVMKRETIYDKKIIPLYKEYAEKLKLKDILYGDKNRKKKIQKENTLNLKKEEEK